MNNHTLLVATVAALTLAGCDTVLVESEKETLSNAKTITIKDTELRACYYQQLKDNNWLNYDQVTSLTCNSDYAINELDGIELLPELTNIAFDGYAQLNANDIAILNKIPKLTTLDLEDGLILSCSDEATLMESIDPSVTMSLPACVEIPFAIANIADEGLSQCLTDIATENSYTLLNQLTDLSCDASYTINSVTGIEQFSYLTNITLNGYTFMTDSELATLSSFENLTAIDLTGPLVLPCSKEQAVLDAFSPLVPQLPECQVSEVVKAINNMPDEALKACMTEQFGTVLNINEVTQVACTGEIKGNGYSGIITPIRESYEKFADPINSESLITTLEGLEQFTAIEEVNLMANVNLTNIQALESLPKLTKLDLSFSGVDDQALSTLGKLTQLTYLDLTYAAGIQDLSLFSTEISKLVNMEELKVRSVGDTTFRTKWSQNMTAGIITDISFIADMTKLRIFYSGHSTLTKGFPAFSTTPLLTEVYLQKSSFDSALGDDVSPIYLKSIEAGSNPYIDFNNNAYLDCPAALEVAEYLTGIPYSATSWNLGGVKLPGACKPAA